MVRIRRVSIGSAFKISAVLSALAWLVFGGISFGFSTLFLVNVSSSVASDPTALSFVEFGGVSMLLIVLCGVPFYAIVGGLSGAVTAFLYNLVAGWVGGLEVELERGLVSAVSSRSVDIPGGGSGPAYGGGKAKNDDPF